MDGEMPDPVTSELRFAALIAVAEGTPLMVATVPGPPELGDTIATGNC